MNWRTAMRFSRTRLYVLLISFFTLLTIAANNGTISSLSVSGGANLNDTITINATVLAQDNISNSNLYFEIRDPNGTVVATNNASVPSMNNGDNFAYSWTSNNASYPSMGNYAISLCWSTGNAQNCNISSANTSFYSVPTLGVPLSLVALFLVGAWFWHVRGKLTRAKVLPT